MATDFSGLFGGNLTPDEMQQAQAEARALQFAKLSPSQQLGFMGYTAGSQLGQGLAKAAGVDIQDPMIKRATQLRQLAQGIDVTTTNGLSQYAQRLQQAGFTEEASKLAEAIQQRKLTEAKTGAEEALKEQRLREKQAADPFQQLVLTGKYTPASMAKYKQSGNPADLELSEKETKANIKEIGVAATTGEAVYLDVNNDKQYIYTTDANGKQTRKEYSGPVDRATAKVTATATSKGDEAFTQELGKLDAKAVSDAQKARDASIAAVKALNTLASYDDSKLISGAFANNRVGIANFLNTIGLANSADKERISNSQQYQKVAGDVILQTLGGKLGSGFSNADREFIAGLVPQLETSADARRKLIEFMQRKNQDIIKEATNLETYARKNKGLGGYTPTIPISQTPGTSAASSLSTEELLKIARGKK